MALDKKTKQILRQLDANDIMYDVRSGQRPTFEVSYVRSDDHLSLIAQLDGVVELACEGREMTITDRGMETIGQLVGLQTLTLNGKNISGHACKHLVQLRYLRQLHCYEAVPGA